MKFFNIIQNKIFVNLLRKHIFLFGNIYITTT